MVKKIYSIITDGDIIGPLFFAAFLVNGICQQEIFSCLYGIFAGVIGRSVVNWLYESEK